MLKFDVDASAKVPVVELHVALPDTTRFEKVVCHVIVSVLYVLESPSTDGSKIMAVVSFFLSSFRLILQWTYLYNFVLACDSAFVL